MKPKPSSTWRLNNFSYQRFSMFPSSSSSTSHKSVGSTSASDGGAGGYGSAPSSFLSAAAERQFSPTAGHYEPKPSSGLQRSYGFSNAESSTATYLKLGDSSSLVRQRSSPAGFLTSDSSGGFSVSRGAGVSRLKPQLSFAGQDSVPPVNENVRPENGHQKASHAYASASFGVDSWENTGSIVFSAPTSKRAKNMDADFLNYISLESQFSLPQTSLEIPEDSIACKIRAKRGCATHPRSIAERERRIRISGKLKKLQDLVPNMDKQTSYADMLDLAVQHIKGLQNQVQNLHKDLESCTCGCKPST